MEGASSRQDRGVGVDRYEVCCERRGESTLLRVRVVPRAKRTAIAGVHGDALKVRLAAPPVDGKANAALLQWLAEVLGLRAADLEIVRGERSPGKVVAIRDVGPGTVARRLARPQ